MAREPALLTRVGRMPERSQHRARAGQDARSERPAPGAWAPRTRQGTLKTRPHKTRPTGAASSVPNRMAVSGRRPIRLADLGGQTEPFQFLPQRHAGGPGNQGCTPRVSRRFLADDRFAGSV